jgi:basic membrane protein A
MKPALSLVLLLAVLALLLIAAGCTRQSPAPVPAVYIVYGSEKGDLSYTDAASQGLALAQRDLPVAIKEFFPRDYETLPEILNRTTAATRPRLIITVGFQYANFTTHLAEQHEDIRFLAIDQAGIGSENIRAYEITSYGDSYLAGVLAASATKSGHVGTILGMQSDVLEAFKQGYTDGARAVNASVIVDYAWVHQYSVDGFTDAVAAERIAEGMYSNGTDVIYTCAGYSNMGAFRAANSTTDRYIIGTDSDQSPLGPEFVLASAVKRVDRIVYASVAGSSTGHLPGGTSVSGSKRAQPVWSTTRSLHRIIRA